MTKEEIRRKYKWIRSRMSQKEVSANSFTICSKLEKDDIYRSVSDLFVYAAIQKEVNLNWLVEAAWADGKRVFFPRVCENDMDFYRVENWTQLTTGAFCVLEPVIGCEKAEGYDGLILVPGIAFSPGGDRIGYGKGYYDRFLSRNKLTSYGIAYDWQLLAKWNRESQDVRVDVIQTENRKVVADVRDRKIM